MMRSLSTSAVTQKSSEQDSPKQPTSSIDKRADAKNDTPRRRSAMASPPALQRTPTNISGSSLVGLMASKRLARRLTSKFFSGRSSMSCSRLSVPIQKEPTYRMEPKKRVQIDRIVPIIEKILEEKLGGLSYNSQLCTTLCTLMGEEIKEKVKRLNFDRYKVVTHVLIGELKNQGLQVSSRCVWDDALDDYATCSFRNKNLFCTVTVFVVYHE